MCELWGNLNPIVAEGWQWTLPMQRLWSLLQDEWPEQASHQTKEKIGKCPDPDSLNYFLGNIQLKHMSSV